MTFIRITIILSILLIIAGAYWMFYLHDAHSSFEKYYAFRGCTELLSEGADYGVCRTTEGKTIRIVKYQGRWYLDGDLPCGFLCF
jgi:hypothetical protein